MDLAGALAFALREGPPPVTEPPEAWSLLTRRERQVADLVATGLSNRAIAERLVISRRTTENHVENILTKLGLSSRTPVAVWVAEQRPLGTQSPE